jgi:hypothetical protein
VLVLLPGTIIGLAELIETIRSAVGDSVVKPLVDAAAERGFIGRGTS